jgi:hypothetical protein
LLLLSGLGAVPAQAAGSVTETAWIALACTVQAVVQPNGDYQGGVPTHIGTALKVTHDATLTPGQTFHLTGVSAFQIVPAAAQTVGSLTFGGDAFAGVVNEFMNTLTPFTMLDANLSTAAPITSMTVHRTAQTLPSGATVHLKSKNAANTLQQQDFVLSAAAPAGSTVLSVVSQTPNFNYLRVGTQITSPSFSAKAGSNFNPGSSTAAGNYTANGALVDQVKALQPPNTDAVAGGTVVAPGAGGTATTLTAGIANGAIVTSLSVAALPAAIPAFTAVTLNPSGTVGTNRQSQTTSALAAAGATTIQVQSFTSLAAYAPGTGVTAPDDKAYVSPDASNPAPGQVWSDNLVAGPSGVYTFGPIPVAPNTGPQPTSFGPAPGVGGGTDPNVANDGTPKPNGGLTVGTLGPSSTFTVTGVPGEAVVLLAGDTTRMVNFGASYAGPLIASATVAFHDGTTGKYQSTFPVACAFEQAPTVANGNANPNPCTAPNTPTGCYVEAFIIPIVAGTVVPEAPLAVMLPLAGLLVAGIWLAYRRGRPAIQQRP